MASVSPGGSKGSPPAVVVHAPSTWGSRPRAAAGSSAFVALTFAGDREECRTRRSCAAIAFAILAWRRPHEYVDLSRARGRTPRSGLNRWLWRSSSSGTTRRSRPRSRTLRSPREQLIELLRWALDSGALSDQDRDLLLDLALAANLAGAPLRRGRAGLTTRSVAQLVSEDHALAARTIRRHAADALDRLGEVARRNGLAM